MVPTSLQINKLNLNCNLGENVVVFDIQYFKVDFTHSVEAGFYGYNFVMYIFSTYFIFMNAWR